MSWYMWPVNQSDHSPLYYIIDLSHGAISSIVYMIWCLFIILIPSYISWSFISLDVRWGYLGTIIGIFPILLVSWSHRVLGENFTASIVSFDDQRLVTNGPYSRIRHPIYTGHTLFHFALFLISANLVLLIFMILVIIYTMHRVFLEEKNLVDRFGGVYIEYMKGTGRFFPKFRSK